MTLNVQFKRSSVAEKRPIAANMAEGEINLNINSGSAGLFFKDSAGNVVKAGPAHVGGTAPNATPGAGGSSGNSIGEFWYDTTNGILKVHDGTDWVDLEAGLVQGVTGTGAITVDNTDPVNPVVSVDSASTTTPGVVQLYDGTDSTSTTQALTANQGKQLQDQINALSVTSNITLAGTFDAGTGLVTTVTASGTAVGFVVGDPLPAAAAGNSQYFVISDGYAASYTPPGGSATEVHIGDWFLSDGSAYQFLDVGFQAGYATTTTDGVVQLSTNAETQAGTNATVAVTPASLQSKVSDSTSTNSSTTIASSAAVRAAYNTATAAQSTANTAVSNAAAAQSSANAAQADATQALSDAAAAQADATQALADGSAAQATADAALPKAGGEMTGNIVLTNSAEITTDDTADLSLTAGPGMNFLLQSLSGNGQIDAQTLSIYAQSTDTDAFAIYTPGTGTLDFGSVNLVTGNGLQINGDAGTAGYILQSNGADAAPTWVAQSAGDVTSVSGTGPITVDNTDPQNPVVDIVAASISEAGAVQLYDDVDSSSTSLAATANAVKLSYDAAVLALESDPLASATVLFVNATTGSNLTGARGTARPFATLTAALAAASNGDTIYVAAGTYTEDVTLNKGVNIIGSFTDQAIANGPKVVGTFTVDISGAGTSNWAVTNLQFAAASAGTNAVVVSGNNFASGGIGTFTNCFFQQFTSSSTTEQAFATSGTWSRSLYLRNCSFYGNFTHNAGTTAGSGGYIVVDGLLGIAAAANYYKVMTGTAEFRNPSNALAPVIQTGGTAVFTNVLGWVSNGANTTSVFGGTGFAYKGTSAGIGQCTAVFGGQGCNVVEGPNWGKLSIGTDVIYAFNNVVYDTSLATLDGAALSTIAPNANGVTSNMARPQWQYLKTASSVSTSNQLGVVLDSSNGNVYTVSSYDLGTY